MSQNMPVAFDPAAANALVKVSEHLFGSGMYPNIRNPAGAFAVVQYGYELGVGPMMALQNINVIQGKPTCSGQLMLALFQQRGGSITVEEESDERVTIVFSKGANTYRCTFTKADANRAGLGSKDNWKKWPAQMLYWRCVAKGVRAIDPGAVMGLYTADEISNGDAVDAADEPRQTTAKAEPVVETVVETVDMEWLVDAIAKVDDAQGLADHWKRNEGLYSQSANFAEVRQAYVNRKAEIERGSEQVSRLTDDQRVAIQAAYNGWDRDERLADIAAIVGRTIASVNDLTKAEASTVIDRLHQREAA
ncbi:hypothetical protein DDE01_11600 [Desulfovibrio desulfuricans]|nr:hypothetical protein DDE01_11600 [Desulfovibrio desulfuricans]